MMRDGVLPGAIAIALLLGGCGAEAEIGVGSSGAAESRATEVARDGSLSRDGAKVVCGDAEYDPARLSDAPLASALPDDVATAADDAGEPAFDSSQDWRVVHRSGERVELIRELDSPMDQGQGDVRTHEVRVIERIYGATNVADGAWMLTLAGPCTQRSAGQAGLGDADLTLAGDQEPGDTRIELFVHERGCASGQSAEGRVELIELVETDEQVRLRIGVRPRSGDQECPGNPSTPFGVELADPLGDREIVDASVVPARRLAVENSADG